VPLTPEQAHLRASIAVNERWAKSTADDREANAIRGQAGLRDRFAREVDPDGQLDSAERERRAGNKYKAHMQRLALASSRARAARKTAGGQDAA
jgi:hypothetical protein